MRRTKQRNILVVGLLSILLLMSVGYAAFATSLSIKGTASVTNTWDIKIINVQAETPVGSAENVSNPTWEDLTASMEANLYNQGDSIEYTVTIKNNGSLNAKLNDFTTNETTSNDAVKITLSEYNNDVVPAGETTTVKVKIEYDPDFTGTADTENAKEVTITLNYGQQS